MKLSDLKVGDEVVIRRGERDKLDYALLYYFWTTYAIDMTVGAHGDHDIIAVYRNGEKIWEREDES